jgi:hypothetical protein
VNTMRMRVSVRELGVLRMDDYLGEFGEVLVDLAIHRSVESAVKVRGVH